MSNGSGAAGQLDIGGVFEKTKDIYGGAFATVWVAALVIWIPTAIIVALLGNEGLLGLIGGLVQAFGGVWLAGTIVRIVQDVEGDGRVDASLGELFGSVWPKLISLFFLSIVLGILIGIGFILLIIPGVILTLMWIVSVPSMVVEDKGIFDSMSRSSELTRGNRMRILGIGILLIVAYIVVILATALLASITPILGIIVGIILAVIIYPYVAIIVAVLYFRLKELHGGAAPAVGGAEGGLEPPVPPAPPAG